jgi:hypothetical protein
VPDRWINPQGWGACPPTRPPGRRQWRRWHVVLPAAVVVLGAIAVNDDAESGSGATSPSTPGVCLDPNAVDYDCAGGSGDGPRYVDGPLEVRPPDPFDLDREGDGVGAARRASRSG